MLRNAAQNIMRVFSMMVPLRIYPYMIPRDVLAVFYHVVSDEELHHVGHLYPVVTSNKFREDLEYLKTHYNFVTYKDLHDHRTKDKELPQRAMHISFDDGYAECFNVVRPILLDLGVPCSFFITTDFVDNRVMYYRNKVSLCIQHVLQMSKPELQRFIESVNHSLNISIKGLPAFLRWIKALGHDDQSIIDHTCRLLEIDLEAHLQKCQLYLAREQIGKMSTEGFTIGAHSKSHRKLGSLGEDEIESEIIDSCLFIQEITAQEVIPFSFPHSAWGIDREILADIRERNSQVGLMFDTKGLRQDVSFIVNRIWAEQKHYGDMELSSISKLLSTAYQDQMNEVVLNWGRRIVKGN